MQRQRRRSLVPASIGRDTELPRGGGKKAEEASGTGNQKRWQKEPEARRVLGRGRGRESKRAVPEAWKP